MKLKQFLIFALFALGAFPLFGQRQIESINDGWRFYKGHMEGAVNISFDDTDWKKITIPHTWNAQDAYQTKDYYRGIGWYRKALFVPKSDKRLYIKFDAALLKADVYINGKLVGTHKGGYTAFNIDITDYVKKGALNTLAVKVDNSYQDIAPLSGDFTLWGGLYRDVWLISTEEVHFDMSNMGSKGIFVETPHVSKEKATVVVRGAVESHVEKNSRIKIVNTIEDKHGKIVARKEQTFAVKPNTKKDFSITFGEIKSPELWSPENPYLYVVKTQIEDLKTKSIIDEITNLLGFRWFKFEGKTGFHLNGEPYKLLGVCRHQDQQGLGSALSDELHRRDMQLIKDMGANYIRISHYPQDDAILEMCDELGLLAWEEIPIVDMVAPTPEFFENTENELREMIRQHYNHPSIIMWGYMNEILLGTLRKVAPEKQEEVFAATQKLAARLEKVLHEEDPHRVSVVAQHEDVKNYDRLGLSSISDVLGWNLYQGWYGGDVSLFGKFMDDQHALHPERPLIVSEYGAGSDKRIHSLQPECFDFSIEYQQYYHEEMMKMILERPHVAGSALWNFIDFGSAFREESMSHINNKGIVYADRTPKDVYYFYQALLRKDPVLHIATRDWTNRTGIKLKAGDKAVVQPIKVYSNMETVELVINGQSLGKKTVTDNMAVWEVPFVDGQNLLSAKGHNGDEQVSDAIQVSFKSQPFELQQLDDQFELGVNVGSTSFFTDEFSGFTWIPEKPYEKGSWGYVGGEILRNTPDRIGIQLEIGGTHNVPLYQTMRMGLEEFRFDVPEGNYEIELHFTEPGERQTSILNDLGFDPNRTKDNSVFNVYINGVQKLQDFNILEQYGAVTAVNKKYLIKAEGEEGINVKFEAQKGLPLISAIKVRKVR